MKIHTDLPAATIAAQVRAREPWFYRFEFPDGTATTGINEYVEAIHADRARVIFPHLDRVYGHRWAELNCLDIASHEGWFSLQLAQRKVASVLGVDIRPERVEKAAWLANISGMANARFETSDLFTLDPAQLGTFDVVLFIGIFYHLENPMGALRVARSLTREVCVMEGQVARGPMLEADWSGPGTARTGPGCILLPGETEHAHEPAGIVIIPTLAALQHMIFRAGFREAHLVLPPPGLNDQYQTKDRVIVFAYV